MKTRFWSRVWLSQALGDDLKSYWIAQGLQLNFVLLKAKYLIIFLFNIYEFILVPEKKQKTTDYLSLRLRPSDYRRMASAIQTNVKIFVKVLYEP